MGYHPYTHAVLGMLNDKNVAGVVTRLQGVVDHWHCATLPGARGLTGEALAHTVHAVCAKTQAPATVAVYPSVEQACRAAQLAAGEGDRIVIFGSFLTVAAALPLWQRGTAP